MSRLWWPASPGSACGGADLHSTLEPCNAAGIRRVVVGTLDMNPLVSGGIKRLRAAGIPVLVGVLK